MASAKQAGPIPFADTRGRGDTNLVTSPEQCKEEHADLISALPSASAADSPVKLRRYQGFWLPDLFLPAAINLRHRFEPRCDDVIVASFPKCGTTWLNALTFATMARAAYPPAGADHPLLRLNPHQCLPFLEGLFKGGREAELEALPSPRLMNTHMPLPIVPSAVPGCRVVYICRDPKNMLCSFGHLKGLDANKIGGLDPILPIPRDALFRNGESGDWVNHMTPEMASHLDEIVAEKMRGTGFTFSDM
uniref:Uncharacterized protein n=1 Tax=Avena sativa TaxID=4498 RepID=A0ACD6AH57_AVESA